MKMREIKDSGPQLAHKASAKSLDLKALNDDGEFEGYLAVFGNQDGGGDVIKKGAFRRTLQERPVPMVKLLWQHDWHELIGKWLDMTEDDYGLKVKGKIFAELEKGKEALFLMRQGVLDGLSIGFRTVKSFYNETDATREIVDVELYEGSLVTFPMNALATVDNVKRQWSKSDVERALCDAGAPKVFAKKLISGGFDLANTALTDGRCDDAKGRELAAILRSAVQSIS